MSFRFSFKLLFMLAASALFSLPLSASSLDSLSQNQQKIQAAVADPLARVASITWRNRDGGKSFMIDAKNGYLWAVFPDHTMKAYTQDDAQALLKDLVISDYKGWAIPWKAALNLKAYEPGSRTTVGYDNIKSALASDLVFVREYCARFPDKSFRLTKSGRYDYYLFHGRVLEDLNGSHCLLPVRPFTVMDRFIADNAALPDLELLRKVASRMLRQRTMSPLQLPEMPSEPQVPAEPELVKGEFETTPQFEARKASAMKERQQAIASARHSYRKKLRDYNDRVEDVRQRYADQIAMTASTIDYLAQDAVEDAWHLLFGDPVFDDIVYDADAGAFTVSIRSCRRDFSQQLKHPVPLQKAPAFKKSVLNLELVPAMRLDLAEGGAIALSDMEVKTNETLHRDAFSEASRQNTVLAYRTFINSYPAAAEVGAAQQKIAALKAEAARVEQARLARRKAEQQRSAEQRRQELARYQRSKSVGEKVCRDGRIFLLPVTITAYVEGINGSRIHIRIADTQGQSIRYREVYLRQGTLIWDDYDNWRHCQ